MRQETRDLVNLQPPRWRLPIWSAAAAAQERGPPGKVAVYCDRLFGRNKLRPSHGEPPSWRRTAVERRPYHMGSRRTAMELRPYRTIRNVPLRGATGSSQTESMEM